MGRGRAKAKQVKVARQIKYNPGVTDLDRLRNELAAGRNAEVDSEESTETELADRYGYLDEDDEEEEEEDDDD